MARKSRKTHSFDAMVKFFMHTYNIPTKKDFDRLLARLDRLELLMEALVSGKGGFGQRNGERGKAGGRPGLTASDMVYETIKKFENGAGFADIQARTGFNDKKLRNIIFRLNKLKRIHYKSRGIYIITP